MNSYKLNYLIVALQSKFQWNKSRIKFLKRFITSLILSSTVNLSRISLHMNTRVKQLSNYRNIQRFLLHYQLNYDEYARFILSIIPQKEKFYIVMDRTNWKFGKTDINVLMLGIIHKNICFPLYWSLLDKRGNSNTKERKELLSKGVNLLGKHKIKALLCDREFIGIRWFSYLVKQEIEFHIRIPNQVKFGSYLQKNRKKVNELFKKFKDGVKIDYLKRVTILGCNLYVSYVRSAKGNCIIVSNKDNYNSLEIYQKRWKIENMFKAFKTSGFNFENTHLKNLEKIKKLIFLVSIVYSWCSLVGLMIEDQIKIRILAHGRKQFSTFKKGLNYLTQILLKLLNNVFYNDFEFKEVIYILSCT
jgi:hypothetical protein